MKRRKNFLLQATKLQLAIRNLVKGIVEEEKVHTLVEVFQYHNDQFRSTEYPLSKELDFLKRLKQTKSAIQKNAPAPNFTLRQPDGKIVSLSQFVGKVVFLNFWASWCGPGVAQIPSERKLSERFKNLVIINISIDTDESSWLNALVTHELTQGINLISKGWTGEVSRSYGVLSIPRYVIIGKDGKIIHPDAPRPSDELLKPFIEAALIYNESNNAR